METGLGQALQDLDVPYSGRSYSGYFQFLGLEKKLNFLKRDLTNFIDSGGEKIVAVSAGGHLIVMLLREFNLSGCDILLLSPVLPSEFALSYQPRSLRIVIGSDDRLYNYPDIENLQNSVTNFSFLLVDGAGHSLPHNVVRSELIALIG